MDAEYGCVSQHGADLDAAHQPDAPADPGGEAERIEAYVQSRDSRPEADEVPSLSLDVPAIFIQPGE